MLNIGRSRTPCGLTPTEDGPWDSDTVTNTYVNGLRTALALQQPTGAWTNGFAYDYAGRLTNVTSQAGSHGYQLGGTISGSPLVKRIYLPGGSVVTNAYDIVGRLLDTALTNSAVTVLNRHEYTYNAAGQRERQTRTDVREGVKPLFFAFERRGRVFPSALTT